MFKLLSIIACDNHNIGDTVKPLIEAQGLLIAISFWRGISIRGFTVIIFSTWAEVLSSVEILPSRND